VEKDSKLSSDLSVLYFPISRINGVMDKSWFRLKGRKFRYQGHCIEAQLHVFINKPPVC
jgi:hypothetical protein